MCCELTSDLADVFGKVSNISSDCDLQVDTDLLYKQLIDETSLSSEEEKEVRDNHALNEGHKLLPAGVKHIFKIFKWKDHVKEEMKAKCAEKLLKETIVKVHRFNKALDIIREFLSSPKGRILFVKVVDLIADRATNEEYRNRMSDLLYGIVDSDFNSKFNIYSNLITKVDQLTPEALVLLSRHSKFPLCEHADNDLRHSVITSDWSRSFVEALCEYYKIDLQESKDTITYCVSELRAFGYVEGVQANGNLLTEKTKVQLTPSGAILLAFVEGNFNSSRNL